jgi:hypothetical protein
MYFRRVWQYLPEATHRVPGPSRPLRQRLPRLPEGTSSDRQLSLRFHREMWKSPCSGVWLLSINTACTGGRMQWNAGTLCPVRLI